MPVLLVFSRIVTYREFVQKQPFTAHAGAGYLRNAADASKSAKSFFLLTRFAHRTSEASLAEQLGDVLLANGLPRPSPADDDRIGGWQLMYQILESNSWLITENCAELIERIPQTGARRTPP